MSAARFSVDLKLAVMTVIVAAAVITLSTAIIAARLRHDADIESEASARRASAQVVGAVKLVFESAFQIVDSTHDSLMAVKAENLADRRIYDTLLKSMILEGDDRYGAWFVWAPGSLPAATDGVEAGKSESGYETYWHQNGVEMLHDHVPSEILESDLYLSPAKHGTAILLEPHVIDAEGGDSVLVTSFSRTLESDGKIIGAIGIDLKLTAIREALSSIDLPAGAAFSVISDGGVVAMSTDEHSDGKNNVIGQLTHADLSRIKQADGAEFVDAKVDGIRRLKSWSAIRFNGVRNPWYVVISVPQHSLGAVMSNKSLSLLAVPVVALLAILLGVQVVVHFIVARPLRLLSGVIEGLGQGLFGLAVPHTRRGDEVGDVARAIVRLQESGEQIARLQEESGEAEYRRLRDREIEMDQLAARFTQSVAEVTQAVGTISAEIMVQANRVGATSEAAIGSIGFMASASATANVGLASVFEASVSMSSAIHAIREETKHARAVSEKVEARTDMTNRSIADLKGSVGRIGDVATVIKAVAGQINLIALNATIEAARAGEMGRGFAVVAQEIKVLASKTAVATDEIGRYILDVRRASHQTDESVLGMQSAMDEMQAVAASIITALDVQTDATEGVRGFVEDAVRGAAGVDQTLANLGNSADLFRDAASAMIGQSGNLTCKAERLGSEVADFIGFIKAVQHPHAFRTPHAAATPSISRPGRSRGT